MSAQRTKTSKIPKHRLSRLAGFGMLTANVAARTAFEGARRLSRGELPSATDILMTPGNILSITDELARMRGAALKMGQLISMDAGELMPRELSDLMARLRADADFMPESQLNSVLSKELGSDWRAKFADFEMRPIAAASIGQVHMASHRDGRKLAVKIQYPGVAKSIDSDIDNVISLFRLTGLAPPREKLGPLIVEAKQQLHAESDYTLEASNLEHFAKKLGGMRGFTLPKVESDLSTNKVLTMSFVAGRAIETVETEGQALRNAIFERLITLALEEFFSFAFTQTDPNFANYSYDKTTDTIGLLDFGAMRGIESKTIDCVARFIQAGLSGDRQTLKALALELSLYDDKTDIRHRSLVDRMIVVVFAAIRQTDLYDFADEELFEKLRSLGMELAADKSFNEVPPAELVFLQRKAIGLYLLGRRLRASIPLRDMLQRYADRQTETEGSNV
ncbi:MAG: AarF/ABC1/UbiB kinase family protein [Pseudomonadota bacterium]